MRSSSPPTDPRDRRNYICISCGRAWRKMSGKTTCPYCGYGRKPQEAPAP